MQLYAIYTAGLFFLLLVDLIQLSCIRSLENVEEANIYPIISQAHKPHILQWIGLIVFTFFFLSFLGLSIADASWASFAMTIVVYMVILTRMIISIFFKKIYYLDSDKIVVADQNNEYITELPINEIEKWNYYFDTKEDCIIASGRYTSIIIEKDSYKNFEEILVFFINTGLVKDDSLRSSGLKNEAIQDFYIYEFIYSFLSIFFVLNFLFWIITHSKSDSIEIQYFQGHIQTIESFQKSNTVRVTLDEYNAFTFKFDEEDIRKYSLANKAGLIGKPVRIGIFKSDYDWKIKNKTIRMLDLNTIPYLNAVSFEVTKSELY